MTQVLNINPNNPQVEIIIKAAEVIKNGGLVVFPTETVYGLGADFFDEKAIKRLAEVKNRPGNKPFTAHISGLEDMEDFGCRTDQFSRELMDKFWPGPLTLIFDTEKSGKTGFRFPNSEIAQELIRQSGTVIAAPSANISGSPAPRTAQAALAQLDKKVDLVLDAGETPLGKESTVIDFSIFPYRILRDAAVPRDRIAETELIFWKDKIAPTIRNILFVCTGNSCRSVMAEGYLRKRLRQIERDDIKVFSRGVNAASAQGPTQSTADILKAEGIDMSRHTSRMLDKSDIDKADLILAMEEFQVQDILDAAPQKRSRVYLLAEFGLWGGKNQDAPLEIPDPIGRPVSVYRDAFTLIKISVERLVKILI